MKHKIIRDDIREERKVPSAQRRLDSLARVLAPRDERTMCLACTIVNGVTVIGANRSHFDLPSVTEDIILSKYVTLRFFLDEDIDINEAYKHLQKDGGLVSMADPESRVKKDLKKLLDLKNKGKLNLSLKPVILVPGLENCKQLIPDFDQMKNRLEREIDDLMQKKWDIEKELGNLKKRNRYSEWLLQQLDGLNSKLYIKQVYLSKLINKNHFLNQIHAEQLVAQYADRVDRNFFNGTRYIGVSKLCCNVCDEALTTYNIGHRGTHNGYYPTYSLLEEKFRPFDDDQIFGVAYLYPNESDSEAEDDNKVPDSSVQAPKPENDSFPNTSLFPGFFTYSSTSEKCGKKRLFDENEIFEKNKKHCVDQEFEEGEIVDEAIIVKV